MSKRAFASREQKKRYIRFAKIQRSSILLLATSLSFIAVSLLVADQLFRPSSFSIDELKIKGAFQYLQPQQVESAVAERVRGNFFAVNLDEMRGEVEKLRWVQSVDIRREWPDTLLVSVVEHKPVMRWGQDKWLTSKARVVDLGDGDYVQNAIKVSGDEEDAPTIMNQVLVWSSRLAELGLSLEEAHLSSTQAWKLKLASIYDGKNEITELILGRNNVGLRFERFVAMYRNNLSLMDVRLQKVDARYPNGLAVTQIKRSESEQERLLGNLDKSS